MATNQAIVVDNGTFETRIGLGGESSPKSVYRSVLDGTLYGESALQNDEDVRSPYLDKSTNWQDFESLLKFGVEDQLKLENLQDRKMLLTYSPSQTKVDLAKMFEILFEKFGVESGYTAMQPILAMYASGRTTGLAVNIGYSYTSVVPVYEGFPYPEANINLNYSGKNLTDYIFKSLNKNENKSFLLCDQYDNIKKKYCYVASNYKEELKTVEEKSYQLPGGKEVHIKEDRIKAPEILFDPSLIGFDDQQPLHEACNWSLRHCDVDIVKPLVENIKLCGGSSLITNLSERLKSLILPDRNLKTDIIPTKSTEEVWIGGSILASYNNFQSHWITSDAYKELGPQGISNKFLKT